MGFETIHTPRHANATERLLPSTRFRLIAVFGGERIRHLGAPPDKTVNLFLDVDKRCFHDAASISRQPVARKAIGMAAAWQSGGFWAGGNAPRLWYQRRLVLISG